MSSSVHPDLVVFGEKAKETGEKDLVYRYQWLQRFFGFVNADSDGVWGSDTEKVHHRAVRSYKEWLKEHGFYKGKLDGHWDAKCAEARRVAITELQKELKKSGQYKGEINGEWNSHMEAIFRRYANAIRDDLLAIAKPFPESIAYEKPALKYIPPAMPTWGKYLVTSPRRRMKGA